LIEANPEHVSELEEILAHDRNVRVLGRAVGASEGTATLLVHTSRTGSTEPASLLPLGEFKEIVATLHTPRTVEVPLTTLDALARDGSIDVRKYNLLLVDVQGAERLVFAGAHESLRHFDAIVTEVNMRPLYVGGALEDELLTDLAALGFAPMFSIDHELYRGDDRFIAWGECLLVRRRS
jgi:FkbM family methyltransferase